LRVDKPSQELLAHCFRTLDARARQAGEPVFVKYLDLGTHVVRLINHSAAFTPHVEKQLTWSLKEEAPRYDATLVIWQDRDIAEVAFSLLGQHDPVEYRKLRVKKLADAKVNIPDINFYDEDILRHRPLIEANKKTGLLSAWDTKSNTYYYAVENLEPEEFIKRGHIFIQTFFHILKSPASSLAHGAVVGLQGTGVLFCAVGYRGKSTLTVNCLLDGFDYVSDDYLVLGTNDGILRAWPIYSVIALSPTAYQAMYQRLQAKFVSNNARKDKYMFNIAGYHDRFSPGYPVKICMFPHITDRPEPSIVPGDKERAIEELLYSSIHNTGNTQDAMTMGRLYSFVDELPFYRFNLSPNIDKNTRCLREFLERYV
jgi:hypothetical protein